MEIFFAIGLIALIIGVIMLVVGIIFWVTRKVIDRFPEKSRGVVIWTVSTVVIYLVLVGIPFTLAIFVPDNRGLWVLVTLGANLWCFGLAYLVYQLFRREPKNPSY